VVSTTRSFSPLRLLRCPSLVHTRGRAGHSPLLMLISLMRQTPRSSEYTWKYVPVDPEQGDIHDRNIEQYHELRRAGQGEDDSFAGVCPAARANSPATGSSEETRCQARPRLRFRARPDERAPSWDNVTDLTVGRRRPRERAPTYSVRGTRQPVFVTSSPARLSPTRFDDSSDRGRHRVHVHE
jgi:hypothetical protein